MRRYVLLLRLKILDLLNLRGLMVVLLAAPLLLGLIAGSANVANQRPDIRLAVIDQDQTAASDDLTDRLRLNGWSIAITGSAAAERLLLRQEIDGILTIESGYADSLANLLESRLSYVQSEGSMVATIVREAVAAAVLPAYSRISLLEQLRRRYAKNGEAPPADLDARFTASMADYAAGPAQLKVTYIGSINPVPTLTYVVSDYSMEVFFLSIYALLGTLTLSQADVRRRLAATRRGLMLDYNLSILALFGLGLAQIIIYSAAMRFLMQMPFRVSEVLLLAVYLLVVLGLGQLFALINPGLRLYLSLLSLLLLSIAGGCFFQLSASLLGRIGQYTPQGWILSTLKGYDALPFPVPLALALAMLALGYYLQKRRVVNEG